MIIMIAEPLTAQVCINTIIPKVDALQLGIIRVSMRCFEASIQLGLELTFPSHRSVSDSKAAKLCICIQ